MSRAVAGLLLAGAAAFYPACAAAQYPERALRLVVPQAAGSATDTVARIVAPEMSRPLGQPVVVENRPGGALTIGIDAVAKAAPDGYTIGMGPIGALAITRHMVAKLPYDIELAVAPSSPVHSVRELIDYAQKNPGKLSNASSSNGSPGHVAGELFKYMTGTAIVHVPYKGGAMAINDLIAGHVQLMFESLNSIAPHARSGKVRALAVSGARRSPGFPDLPTIAEAGVPGYEAGTWTGIIAPAGLPQPLIDRLNAAVNEAIRSPIFKDRFALIGDEPAGGTPAEFADTIRKDSARWRDVVQRSGAKID
jgi:tripartite-type tricarboxylate transporter receptor subunit TctC